MAKYQQMSLISFQKQFSTQEACHDYLFSLKWSNGYCCEKCGHDAYFGAPSEGGKRGRGTEKTKVLVGLSLNKKGHPLYLKMEVVPNIKSETLIDFAEKRIQPGSTISSDAYHSYRSLEGAGFKH